MQKIHNSYRGVSLVLRLSADRLLFLAAIAASLAVAAGISLSLLSQQAPSGSFFF